jgi:hypothetical protein
MAYFAELDENNIVTQVLVTYDNFPNEGYNWLVETFGGTWVQTSYNATIRKNFAGIGFNYDEDRDAFIPPKPFESWLLNEETCNWEASKPYPTDQKPYKWDEDSQEWIEYDNAN